MLNLFFWKFWIETAPGGKPYNGLSSVSMLRRRLAVEIKQFLNKASFLTSHMF